MRNIMVLSLFIFTLSACQTVMVKQKTKKIAIILLNDGTKQTEILGYSMDSNKLGMNEPLIFTALNGRVICSGTYTLQSQYDEGRTTLNCFDGRIKGEGTFKVQGRRGAVSYGVAELKTPNETLKIVFGISNQDFNAYRRRQARK